MFVCDWTNIILIYTLNSSVSSHFFTFALMMTEAFRQNISKLFSKPKLETDNLPLHINNHCLQLYISLKNVRSRSYAKSHKRQSGI